MFALAHIRYRADKKPKVRFLGFLLLAAPKLTSLAEESAFKLVMSTFASASTAKTWLGADSNHESASESSLISSASKLYVFFD